MASYCRIIGGLERSSWKLRCPLVLPAFKSPKSSRKCAVSVSEKGIGALLSETRRFRVCEVSVVAPTAAESVRCARISPRATVRRRPRRRPRRASAGVRVRCLLQVSIFVHASAEALPTQ